MSYRRRWRWRSYRRIWVDFSHFEIAPQPGIVRDPGQVVELGPHHTGDLALKLFGSREGVRPFVEINIDGRCEPPPIRVCNLPVTSCRMAGVEAEIRNVPATALVTADEIGPPLSHRDCRC